MIRTQAQNIVEIPLEMGQIRVSAEPALVTCYGIGSCMGVFLYDRVAKIGGGAHITLPFYDPGNTINSKLHYADYAIETLVERLKVMGSSGNTLRAKIAGGANIGNFSRLDVGKQNSIAVCTILRKMGIYLAGCDIGGLTGRKIIFNTSTGSVQILTNQDNYTI
ncbi:chemotaxis protein CheD [Rhodocytophaga aerolata]|uniref:Probable chemoreceptor glutamine deamidase CheD n=1 Tax=Rhodocytophaga aerolata TaxID=455078 RepID=A0ABT8R3M2_9BACT|nr:chemotaxis protein CheD [Rhodocytophaga aerolata]MDO1446692.1 chemotaxis protein CheD [Rhodocytophaga aerolata]